MTNQHNFERAWALYCKEKEMRVSDIDIWYSLPEETKQYYLTRVSPRSQAIEILARLKLPYYWEEVDSGDCPRDNYYVEQSLKQAEAEIEALEEAGLVISQKEEKQSEDI